GVDLLGEASNAIDTAAQLDSGLADSAGQLLDLYYTAKDLSGELASRLEDYESNDAELDEIEQRLDLIYKLKRKYGDTVEDVLAFGEKAREELERIQFSQEHHDRRSEEHTSELQSRFDLVCRLLLEKKNIQQCISASDIVTICLMYRQRFAVCM